MLNIQVSLGLVAVLALLWIIPEYIFYRKIKDTVFEFNSTLDDVALYQADCSVAINFFLFTHICITGLLSTIWLLSQDGNCCQTEFSVTWQALTGRNRTVQTRIREKELLARDERERRKERESITGKGDSIVWEESASFSVEEGEFIGQSRKNSIDDP